jgi:hypothetical protein
MTRDRKGYDDIFDRLIVDDQIRPDYQADLRRRMLETFEQTRRQASQPRHVRMLSLLGGPRRRIGIAIAASLFIGLFGWSAWRPAPAHLDVSFAAVVERVQQMDAVQYRQTITFAATDRSPGTTTADIVNVDAPHWQIIQPDGQVLRAHPTAESAPASQPLATCPVTGPLPSPQAAPHLCPGWNVFDQLLRASPESVTANYRKQTINDRPAVSFCIERPQRTAEVWVDTQTRLPVVVQDVSADKTGKVTASDLHWIPKGKRETTLFSPRPPAPDPSGGKILVVPTGGNIDNMPMMAIPPGSKILIPGNPDQSADRTARSREDAFLKRFPQDFQENYKRRLPGSTQSSASQPATGPAQPLGRVISVQGDVATITARLRRMLDNEYGSLAPQVVPGGRVIIILGKQDQVDRAIQMLQKLQQEAAPDALRPAASLPNPPPATGPASAEYERP